MMLACIRRVIFSRDRNIVVAQGIMRLLPEYPCHSASRKDKFPLYREKYLDTEINKHQLMKIY